jgi:hypothetical protein
MGLGKWVGVGGWLEGRRGVRGSFVDVVLMGRGPVGLHDCLDLPGFAGVSCGLQHCTLCGLICQWPMGCSGGD